MKRLILIAVAVFVIGLLYATCAASSQEVSAGDLWFPGGPGSNWIYVGCGRIDMEVRSCPWSINDRYPWMSIQDVEKKIEEWNRYKHIYESSNLLGLKSFLNFRTENNRVLGDGAVTNQDLAQGGTQTFIDLYEQLFPDTDISEANIQFEFLSDEWVLLETPEVGHEWTVAKCEAKAKALGKTVTGTWELRGRILEKEETKRRIMTSVKVATDPVLGDIRQMEWRDILETLIVEYEMITKVEGCRTITRSACKMWLAPNVGLVKLQIGDLLWGGVEAVLDFYEIIPVQPAKNPDKLRTTWGEIKQVH